MSFWLRQELSYNMIQEILNQMAERAELPMQRRQEIQTLFAHFPAQYAADLRLLSKQRGQTLVYLQDPADRVFLLLRGTVSCLTPMINGAQYQYAQFQAPFFLGEFEAFSACPFYRSTVVCSTAAHFLVMSRQTYLSWMQQDVHSLFQRTCAITTNLGEQARMERERLFCTGVQRLAVHLLTHARQKGNPAVYRLRQTMQDMADGTGCSVKTIQRSLARLVAQGAVIRERRGVCFDAAQYAQLLALAFPDPEPAGGPADDRVPTHLK